MANARSQIKAPQTSVLKGLPMLEPVSLLTAMQANNRLLDAAMQLNTEIATFFSHRLSEDFTLPGKLAASQNTEQMAEIYSDFFSNTSREYMAEFEKITTILSTLNPSESSG